MKHMTYPKIIWENKGKDLKSEDKKEVELLKKQIHELLEKDKFLAKKSALILEQWIQGRKKR